MGPTRQVLILCEESRRPAYEEYLADRPFEIIFVKDAKDFLCHSLEHSPLAGMVDLVTPVRGTADLLGLFDLPVRWPVVRTKLSGDAKGQMMSTSPPRRSRRA